MAISHLQFNRSFYHGNLLAQGLALETARETLIKARDCMQTMINGDGSSIAHFDEVVKKFGVDGWVADNVPTDAQRTVDSRSTTNSTLLFPKSPQMHRCHRCRRHCFSCLTS